MARLDHERFSAAGGDWGGRVTTAPAVRHPERVEAIHTFTPYADVPAEDGDLGERERISLQETRDFWNRGGSHSLEQSTRPQSVSYALSDSPIGQLAWITQKFHDWTDDGDHLEVVPTRAQHPGTSADSWSKADRGGHFPVLEVPERYVAALVSACTAIRSGGRAEMGVRRAATGRRGRAAAADQAAAAARPGHDINVR
ncbi:MULTISPECIES: hypothetical protein [unclassified Streptomyces]|uniref:alpha/beta fold hydrolase n=1 Tax=unclassified Streptomyces TaxID=2593676 RepID=UPI00247431F6|nr:MULTISPECIES: hypothetical protein [unclassified Streptomyces]